MREEVEMGAEGIEEAEVRAVEFEAEEAEVISVEAG